MSNENSEPAETKDYKEVEPPRDVRIERETREMYEALKEDESSPYQDGQLYVLFLNAAAHGKDQGLRQPIEGETMALFQTSSLSSGDWTRIRSLAWAETQDEEIYYNHKLAIDVVRELANGGIRYMHQTSLGIGDNLSESATDAILRWQEIEPELEERGLINTE